MIGLFVFLCAMIFLAFVFIYKTVTVSVFKLLAFAIDYFIIVFYSVYYFNSFITVKFFSENMIYVINALLGLAVIIVYTILILSLNSNFPKISSALNLFMSFLGVSIAIPITIGLLTPVIHIFNHNFSFNGDIIITHNLMLNLFLKYLIFGIAAIPVWHYRMNKING